MLCIPFRNGRCKALNREIHYSHRGREFVMVKIVSKALAPHVLRDDTSPAVYLSEDFITFSKLKREYGSFLDIGDRFHRTYREYENQILDVTARLNMMNESDWFWASSIASRNSGDTPFVREIIYSLVALQIAKEHKGKLILILEHHITAKCLAAYSDDSAT